MVIVNIKIRNFKSFGNNLNEITLSVDKGELILLQGANGAGKSSIIEAFDFALYGKVRGKKKKYLTNDTLPNRYNKNLEVILEFSTTDHQLTIKRTISPNKLEFFIDGENYDRAGKVNVQAKIEEIIGFDIDTFKSFISMSINDFKNFMILTPDEKRMLLDRLFHLDMINEISKIIKEKRKNIAQEGDVVKAEIRSYEQALVGFKGSLDKIKVSAKKNVEDDLQQTKAAMMERREEYEMLAQRMEKANSLEMTMREEVQQLRDSVNQLSYTNNDIKKKITLFDSGVCPTCANDLTNDTNQAYKTELLELLGKNQELQRIMTEEGVLKKQKYDRLYQLRDETNVAFTELKTHLAHLKAKLQALKQEDTSSVLAESIHEIVANIDRIEERKFTSSTKLNTVETRSMVVDQLSKMFSEDGIKSNIISKIVVPINHYIQKNLEKLDMSFGVKLDDQFTAQVTLMGQEIEADSLSSGETKLINLVLMISYLQLIRTRKNINVLFLDEVFSTIDVENIYLILKMLRSFADEHNTNIFLVHHAMLEKSYFDKVYAIQKDVTSRIELLD